MWIHCVIFGSSHWDQVNTGHAVSLTVPPFRSKFRDHNLATTYVGTYVLTIDELLKLSHVKLLLCSHNIYLVTNMIN